MCGIVAILRRRATRGVPDRDEVLSGVASAAALLEAAAADRRGVGSGAGDLGQAADRLAAANKLLSGVPGLRLLLESPDVASTLRDGCEQASTSIDALERRLDADSSTVSDDLERLNQVLIRARDSLWSISRDRLRAAEAVAELLASPAAPSGGGTAAVEAFLSIHQALSALDRLEVRGRDSAGIHLQIHDHGLDLDDPSIASALKRRGADELFGSGSVRLAGGTLGIVYKTAAEIGELGDNTAALRSAIASDRLLAAALSASSARVLVLGHTRWASVGIISEANAHPLNSELLDASGKDGFTPETSSHPLGSEPRHADDPYVVAALNGDVDNYAELLAKAGAAVAPAITTDSKSVPVLTGLRMAQGLGYTEAFRRTVASCEGSVAVAACTPDAPDRLLLALRGSGQGLYVGFVQDAYVVASEPTGVVEETSSYLRMDGEVVGNVDNPTAGRGQIVSLDGAAAGSPEGVSRWGYDGTGLPVSPDELVTASVTTRDIDRGDHAHFLLKEIGQASASFRKTLRSRIIDGPGPGSGGPRLSLGADSLPDAVRSGLRSGSVRSVIAMGQGTAAVAAQSVAESLRTLLRDAGAHGALEVVAMAATELSAFHLRADMSDTVVVAVSQSGTTTDTNRTVDLVRARGASVIAIVNRRNSDLTERADGVLYTSDGRDVEMSVASTKAFYSQVAAGCLLAVGMAAEAAGERGAEARRSLLESLREMPAALDAILQRRPGIGEAARRLALSRRYWAVVGNGPNQIAAREVRIKLSELCYKSISSDATEDKKHIDLSAEPLVLVCAAGLSGSVADDVAKEVAIFGAHRAAPVVIADDGDTRFDAAAAVLGVPATDPRLAFLPAVMVGHLFGYEAALAIDSLARPLRECRAAIERAASRPGAVSEEVLEGARAGLERGAAEFSAGLGRGAYDGTLEASTAVRLAGVMRYALGRAQIDAYEVEHGRIGTPAAVLDDLTAALTEAIDQLTRPIDAIRHQAKTVTVGISRSDQTLLETPLSQAVLAAGAPRDHLAYSSLQTLAGLAPSVEEVLGHTRYQLQEPGAAVVVSQGGIAAGIVSRTVAAPRLTGTKRTVAAERSLLVARGRYDGRTVILVPEVAAGATVGITLLHVRFAPRLSVAAARGMLQGYRNRYSELRDAVTETEPDFDESLLAGIAAVDLLTAPIAELAERWRGH